MSTKYPQGIITPTPPYKSTTAKSFSGVWTLEQLANNFYYYKQAISKSLRLRASASAYLSRTPASMGNQRTWTWSGWVKRGTLGSAQVLFSSDVGTSNSTWLEFGFDAGDTFTVTSYTTDISTTSAVFRDPSSWYHIVVAFDSTQSTTSNRCRIYFNGVQQSLTGVGFTLNATYGINVAQAHAIGQRNWSSGVGRYFDGYMAEINFIDGQALEPSYFGQISPITGVWSPAPYVGSYGTNGFYLKFTDTTSTTTLCYDYSGNSNNWTPNNISLTAGSTYDSMLDSPTNYDNGGTGVGNYAVANPLSVVGSTLTDGNLSVSVAGGFNNAVGSIAISSGKWYWENTVVSATTNDVMIGIVNAANAASARAYNSSGTWYYYGANGNKYVNGSSSSYGSSYTAGDVVGIAFDSDNGTLTFYKNGVSQGVAASSGLTGISIFPVWGNATGGGAQVYAPNFGQRPFAYTPPTGYKALNTQNLSAPSIVNGAGYMAATLYTGNGATQNIVNANNGVSFQPDLIWGKDRSSAYDNTLIDSIRGVGKELFSNSTSAENNNPGFNVTAFNSNGFALAVGNQFNRSGDNYVAWQWKAGGTAVTNTAGNTSAQVSANPTSGFSVITWTEPASGVVTLGHGLGVTPSFYIVKYRSVAGINWGVYHASLGAGYYLWLNTTDAASASSSLWNNTAPTSSVLTIGSYWTGGTGTVNMVAYAFAAIPGYSAFGSYTGNGSADGPFVYCGFRPRYVLIKRTDSTGQWAINDSSRNPYNVTGLELFADLSDAESNDSPVYDFLSNGFKIRNSYASRNASGGTYVYAAFAENPFNYSLAR